MQPEDPLQSIVPFNDMLPLGHEQTPTVTPHSLVAGRNWRKLALSMDQGNAILFDCGDADGDGAEGERAQGGALKQHMTQ